MIAVMYDEIARRRLERPRRRAVAVLLRLGGGGVRHDLPRLGRGHRELEGRLEVGLLEHGEHATRIGHLELRVEVDLAVDRIDEAMQALTGVRVQAVGIDDELVLGLESGQRDARVGELRKRDVAAVERDGVDVARDQVDEGVGTRGRGEADDRAGSEDLGALRQIERHLVRVGVDDRATLLRLDAGEVLSRHCCSRCVRGFRMSQDRRMADAGNLPSLRQGWTPDPAMSRATWLRACSTAGARSSKR